MITVAQALTLLEENVPAGPAEEVTVSEALGRVLAREVRSDVDWPPFDMTAMDGYAVRLADLSPVGTALKERPELVAAGEDPQDSLGAGEAVRVMTGAPLPEGTEAIVPIEQARRGGGWVLFEALPSRGAHIRRRGESLAAGNLLLPAGKRLSATDVALAALAGCDPIRVAARPRVTIAATGNEVVTPSDSPGRGSLRDSNGPMLLSLCRSRNWPSRMLPPVPDRADAVEKLFARAGEVEDFLVTTGGVSAGDLDLLPEAAKRQGFEILFHRVAVRPGKPIAFGRRGKTFWFGLPGNPVSASVTFHLFVRYALDLREADASPGVPRVCARLAREARASGSRETYQDSLLTNEAGENRVEPLPSAGSHDIATHARANVLLRIPAETRGLEAGSPAECLLLQR